MNVERWKKIDELFDAVLDLPAGERERFLSEQTNGDEDLKNEVISLLKAGTNTDKFLETSAMNIAARNLAEEGTVVFSAYFLDKTIGTFKIERLLGAGGMGEVYLARDERLKRKIALKILPAEYISSDERVRRFQLEARAISALNHPNIVTVYDVGTFNGINYIATEYVEGKTIRELIGSGLKRKDVLSIIIQACEALSTAHSAGIIHRDIKPENIMVRPDGYVKILDFGLAKLSDISPHTLGDFNKTAKGVIIGTPAYMSPEQVADEKVDYRTDLWSLGVVLYELLTGVNPFKKENRQATFQAILSQDPPPASAFDAKLPNLLDQILIKALEKNPDLSYQTASDLRADLKRVNREFDSLPSTNDGFKAHLQTRKNIRSYLFGAVLSALVLIGGWFLVSEFFLRQKDEIPPDWALAKNSPLTDESGLKGYTSFAPDGNSFVYSAQTEKGSDIFLQIIGGKNPQNITNGEGASNSMPAFSPDGKLIAFRSNREPPGIYVMGVTGENPRRVSDIGNHPSWSPDNKSLVVSTEGVSLHNFHTVPNSVLWTIEIATGEKKRLETGTDAIQPAWSPNGYRIAFWFISEGRQGNIATVPATGGEPITVASHEAADWNPVWSPDGKYLYFASNRGGNMSIWRIRIDEQTGKTLGEAEAVPSPSKYVRHFSFSGDGKRMVYGLYNSQSNLQAVSFDPQTEKAGSNPVWITRGTREISFPHLSPDGEKYVLRTPALMQEDLVVINKDGSNWRQLTDDEFFDRRPRWSPDGRRIAFQSTRSGKYQIWTINGDGTNIEQITDLENSNAVNPAWSPDGKRLVFNEILNDDAYIPIVIETGKKWHEQTPQKLVLSEKIKSFMVRDWSKDGDKLLGVLISDENKPVGIGFYSFASRSFKLLTNFGGYPTWLNDSRRFIFQNDSKIYLADSLTKETREIFGVSEYGIEQADISPDNKTIYFRYIQIEADIWLLDLTQN